jgi:hypothetical protein
MSSRAMKGEILTEFTRRLREWGVPNAPKRARVLVDDLERMRIELSQPVHLDNPDADWRALPTPARRVTESNACQQAYDRLLPRRE